MCVAYVYVVDENGLKNNSRLFDDGQSKREGGEKETDK